MSWKRDDGWSPQHKTSTMVIPAGSPVLGNSSSLLGAFPQKVFLGATAPVATFPRAALRHQAPDKGCRRIPSWCYISKTNDASAQLFSTAPTPAGSLSLSRHILWCQPCSSPSKMFLEPSSPTMLNNLLDSLIFIISVLLPS